MKAIKEGMQSPKLTQQVIEVSARQKLSVHFNNLTIKLLEDLLYPAEGMSHQLARLQALSGSELYVHMAINREVLQALLDSTC